MNKQQQDFCKYFIYSRNPKESALKAGYSKSFSESKAYQLPEKYKEYIAEIETEYYATVFKALAIDSVKALREIIQNSENDSARLSASKYVLELTGAVEPQHNDMKIEIRMPDEYRN